MSRLTIELHIYVNLLICRQNPVSSGWLDSTLYCVVVCCSMLQCVTVCCSDVLHCVAGSCNVLQCVAVCCSVLQCVAVCKPARSEQQVALDNMWQCVVVCFNAVVQYVAVCCSVLPCVAACCSVLQCVDLHDLGGESPKHTHHILNLIT